MVLFFLFMHVFYTEDGTCFHLPHILSDSHKQTFEMHLGYCFSSTKRCGWTKSSYTVIQYLLCI